MEEVGADPTAAVETAAPVDTQKKDPGTDVYDFKEYDLKEYDNKEFVEKPYDYGDYGDYVPTDAKPTSATYDGDFGPGVPAETGITESNVSTGVVRSDCGGGGGQECGKMEKMLAAFIWWGVCSAFLFVASKGIGF